MTMVDHHNTKIKLIAKELGLSSNKPYKNHDPWLILS